MARRAASVRAALFRYDRVVRVTSADGLEQRGLRREIALAHNAARVLFPPDVSDLTEMTQENRPGIPDHRFEIVFQL